MTDARARHIRNVLRARVGDELRVGLVDGPRGTATVLSVTESRVTLAVHLDPYDRPMPLPLHLVLGHPRPPVLRRVLVDLASLNVATVHVFHPVLGEQSYFQSSVWRELRSVLIEGASQGGHTRVPTVQPCRDLTDALDRVLATVGPCTAYFGDAPAAEGPTRSAVRCEPFASAPTDQPVCTLHDALNAEVDRHRAEGRRATVLAVAADRGWSDAERVMLRSRGFTALTAGTTILRTEAAAVALAVALASVHTDRAAAR